VDTVTSRRSKNGQRSWGTRDVDQEKGADGQGLKLKGICSRDRL
jgi:hypothetical protein